MCEPEPLQNQRMMLVEGGVLRKATLHKEMGFITQDPKGDLLLVEALKSVVDVLIKYHEECIGGIISCIETRDSSGFSLNTYGEEKILLQALEHEYETIMMIEHWLEDVIEIEPKCEMCGCAESYHYVEKDEKKYGDKQEHCICKTCGICY
jgi:hypothetical protein